ncbi:MAG: hypothetical protein KDB35_21115 [Acidimicrobiales bacterium]|nr:hypothetical protein [Acidimicrobiales bacterium]
MTSNQTEADGGATDTSPETDPLDAPADDEATTVAATEDTTGHVSEPSLDEDLHDPDDTQEGADDADRDVVTGETGTQEASVDDEEASVDDEEASVDDEEDDEEGPSRVVLLVGAAVAFVAIAIVGILIASGGDSGGGDGETSAAPADARTDVGVFGTIDQFDRPDSATTMGDFAPSRPWSADAGTWGIDNGEAYLVRSGEFRNHSVVGLGQGDGGAQVRLDKVVNGAGLVFRYVGPYNYWAVVAVPDVATWNVVKVVDGDQEVVGNTGQSPTADGTTVGVRMRGDTIDVIINGRVRKTIVDDFQAEAGKVGLTARGPDSGDARFDDFVAGLPNGVPLSGGQGGGAAATGGGGSSSTTAAP